MAILFLLLGLLLALVAHLGCKLAERRAREVYRELVGEEAASEAPDDVWKEARSLIGGWGCLVTGLEFVRGVGLVVALAAVLFLVTGR